MRIRRGLSPAERQELREDIRRRALADAERHAAVAGLTPRCQRAMDGIGDHTLCQGESPPAGTGCLCTCHDNPGVTIEQAGDPQ
jgi:hypothetical protein